MLSEYPKVKRGCVEATRRDSYISISTAESSPTGIRIVGLATPGYGSRVERDRTLISLELANVSDE